MGWNYQREESAGFELIPEGHHRIRIKSAEMAVSKSGNNMIALQFDVSEYAGTLYHYIVFMNDKPEVTNRMLTQFYDSFKDIPEGDNHLNTWIGKVGACAVKHDEYNGNKKAKISWFIKADKQGDLPAWSDPKVGNGGGNATTTPDGFIDVTGNVSEDIPF